MDKLSKTIATAYLQMQVLAPIIGTDEALFYMLERHGSRSIAILSFFAVMPAAAEVLVGGTKQAKAIKTEFLEKEASVIIEDMLVNGKYGGEKNLFKGMLQDEEPDVEMFKKRFSELQLLEKAKSLIKGDSDV